MGVNSTFGYRGNKFSSKISIMMTFQLLQFYVYSQIYHMQQICSVWEQSSNIWQYFYKIRGYCHELIIQLQLKMKFSGFSKFDYFEHRNYQLIFLQSLLNLYPLKLRWDGSKFFFLMRNSTPIRCNSYWPKFLRSMYNKT